MNHKARIAVSLASAGLMIAGPSMAGAASASTATTYSISWTGVA